MLNQACGTPVYKLRLNFVQLSTYTHSELESPSSLVDLSHRYTLSYAQLCTYIYTVYLQLLDNISSVSSWFVHSVHIAYKKEFNLRKGII